MTKDQHKAPELRRIRAVALPVMNLGFCINHRMRIDSPMVNTGKAQRGNKQRTAMGVTDLNTGEALQLLPDDVLRRILNDGYPAGGYVGRSFDVIRHKRVPPKREHTYSVFELDA
jgi:hypothetical protein